MISGKVLGAVSGKSCLKAGGPSGVKLELLSDSDELVGSASTSSTGEYSFANIIPGFSCLLCLMSKKQLNLVHASLFFYLCFHYFLEAANLIRYKVFCMIWFHV
jgi:hypothetical protein